METREYLEEQVEGMSSLVEDIDALLDDINIEIDESIDTTEEYLNALAEVIYENRDLDTQVLEALVDGWYALLESELEFKVIEESLDASEVDWTLFETDGSEEDKQRRLHSIVLAHQKWLDQADPEKLAKIAKKSKLRWKRHVRHEKEKEELGQILAKKPAAPAAAPKEPKYSAKAAESERLMQQSFGSRFAKTPPWKLTKLSQKEKKRRALKRGARYDLDKEHDYLAGKKPGGVSWMHHGGVLGPRETRPAHTKLPHHVPAAAPIKPTMAPVEPKRVEPSVELPKKRYAAVVRPGSPEKRGPQVQYVKKLAKSS